MIREYDSTINCLTLTFKVSQTDFGFFLFNKLSASQNMRLWADGCCPRSGTCSRFLCLPGFLLNTNTTGKTLGLCKLTIKNVYKQCGPDTHHFVCYVTFVLTFCILLQLQLPLIFLFWLWCVIAKEEGKRKPSHYKKGENLSYTLRILATRRPKAAPHSSEGTKRPLGTETP